MFEQYFQKLVSSALLHLGSFQDGKRAPNYSRSTTSWIQAQRKKERWLFSEQWQLETCGIWLTPSVMGAQPWTSPYGQRSAINRNVSHDFPTWNTCGPSRWEECFPKVNQAMTNQRRANGYWVLNFISDLIWFGNKNIEILPKVRTIQKDTLREASPHAIMLLPLSPILLVRNQQHYFYICSSCASLEKYVCKSSCSPSFLHRREQATDALLHFALLLNSVSWKSQCSKLYQKRATELFLAPFLKKYISVPHYVYIPYIFF